jgi:hypothetical protein
MSLSRIREWASLDILFASDLNAEFLNIYTGGESLAWPATTSKDLDGNELILDVPGNTSITSDTDNVIHFRLQSIDLFTMTGSVVGVANGLNLVGTVAADPVQVLVTGSDDIGITFDAVNSEPMLILGAATAAANQITISSAATTANPTIACTGESDIGITFENQDAEAMLILDSVATTKNWVKITSAATTNDPSIVGIGEAGAGLLLQGAGTGTVKIGDASIEFPDSDGAANSILITDGAAAASFTAASYAAGPAANSILPLPRSYLAGLQMTRTDANTITIAVGQSRNTGDDTNIIRVATLAKDIDATWAAGAGGGLNATDFATGGSDCEASTWYHVFVIEDGSGTVDAGFDKSVTAANLRSDSSYTKYRRIGSVRTDAAKDIIDFVQTGDNFTYAAIPALDVDEPNGNYDADTAICTTRCICRSNLCNCSVCEYSCTCCIWFVVDY